MKTLKFKIKKTKDFFKKLPRVLAIHSFLTLFGLLIIVLIFGGLIFYKYVISVKNLEPKITEEPIQLKEKTFENILKIWQERGEKFKASSIKQYPNPFQRLTK